MREPQTEGSDLAFDLIDRLHKSLRVSGHTPQSLAAVLGTHPNTINNYLSGRTRPSRVALIAWAFAVDHGVTVEWLETGEGVMPNPPSGRQEARGPTEKLEELRRRNLAKGRGRRPETDTDGETRKYGDPVAA